LKERLRKNFENHFIFLDTIVNPVNGAFKIALKNFKQ